MMNLDSCRVVVWGFKHRYHTHSHIHEGFYRAFKYLGRDVSWLDHGDSLDGYDFSDTLFITEHDAAKYGMPVRDDCFYVVHGLKDDPEMRDKIPFGNRISWNVFHDTSHVYNSRGNPFFEKDPPGPLTDQVWLGPDAPFYPNEHHMDFRWATDLTPPEIEANKVGAITLNTGSSVINYVGSYWHVNAVEISEFGRACRDAGVELRHHGAGQVPGHEHMGHSNVVSPEDNVRLVRESHFAPAILGSHHITEGYAPCRLFKNISYGQFGVTNSARMQQLFGGKLIYDPDPYKLFFVARERLSSTPVCDLHALMDEVAARHTYVNRLETVFKAVRLVLEGS